MSSILQYGAWVLALASLVAGNYTSHGISSWDRPRAAVIRDDVYVEGGWLQTGEWQDGAWGSVETVNPTVGMLFKLSLRQSFDMFADGTPARFESIVEGAIQNFYLDGYMFADYNEFYAWG